ncbi:DNA repair protein XRCC2 isoform X2 [Amia ocellicauda]
MLYHLVARCILPAEHGGLEAEVVFVDTDFHFDMLRLVAVLEHRLPRSSEEALRSCLHRLFVAHCGGTAQLLLTLHYLEGLFCSRPTLSLLVLDSVSTFYWTDRGGGEGVASQELGLRKCAELLQRLLRDYRLVLVATTQAIMRNYPAADSCGAADGSSSSSSSSSWRGWHSTDTDYSKPYLCRAWQKMVTHRLVFSRADAGQDGRQVFSIVSSSLRSKSTQRSAFYVGEGGVQFL